MRLLGIAIGDDSHYFGGSATFLNELRHQRHGGAGVHKEQFKPFAKIVLPLLPVARNAEAVLGTTAIA